MIDILLIADQQRLHSIFAKASDIAGVRLRVATGLNQGVQEIAADTPSLLFIQSRLSGLSGEIITRHVKSELKGGTTKIILFTDAAGEGKGETLADVVLDLTIPDKELEEEVREIIIGHGPVQQGETPLPSVDSAQGALNAAPLAEAVTDSVSIGREETAATTFQQELESLIGKSAPVAAEEEKPATPGPQESEGAAKETFAFDSPHYRKGVQRKNNLLWPAVSVLALVVIAGAFLFSSRSHEQAKKADTSSPPAARILPAEAIAPVQSTAPALPPLPAFIPREGMDKPYGETHPGWERYTTAAAEFKVYREKSAIKAIQVIARSGEGVRPLFFTKVLLEIAGVRDYRLEAKEQKGEYLVKKGRLSAKSRVILYKNKSDTILQAFVIYFE